MALSRLKKKYVEEIVPDLMERLQYKSVMQVPKIKKISINQGLGAAVNDKKLVQSGVDELTLITGQKAVATKAKKSISNFKLREDMPIGAKTMIFVATSELLDFKVLRPPTRVQEKTLKWRP